MKKYFLLTAAPLALLAGCSSNEADATGEEAMTDTTTEMPADNMGTPDGTTGTTGTVGADGSMGTTGTTDTMGTGQDNVAGTGMPETGTGPTDTGSNGSGTTGSGTTGTNGGTTPPTSTPN